MPATSHTALPVSPPAMAGRRAVAFACLIAIIALGGCGGGVSRRSFGLSQKGPEAGALRGDSLTTYRAARFFLHFFGDTLDSELRYLLSFSDTATPDLRAVLSALRERGITAYTIAPATWEALYASASLPVLSCLTLQRFASNNITPLSAPQLADHPAIDLPVTGNGAQPEIQIVGAMAKPGAEYTARSMEGMRIRGLPRDPVPGLIIPPSSKGPGNDYTQVTGLFFLTQMPLPQIEHHLDEWFQRLPYTYERPEVAKLETKN
jgi:hypothetical protein